MGRVHQDAPHIFLLLTATSASLAAVVPTPRGWH